MENATKALFIAIGVLMGIMILSLGVALYYSLQGYISDTQDTMEQNANNQFNTQFIKYINMQLDSSGTFSYNGQNYRSDFKLRIQDIITVANIAYQNNIEHNPNIVTMSDSDYEALLNENSLYITVNATLYDESGASTTKKHLEKNIDKEASNLLSQYTSNYLYKCYSEDVKFSKVTGRVYEITFR